MSEAGEKTFDPTDQRREQFRKDGRYPKARDAGGIAAALATVGALVSSRDGIGRAVHLLFAYTHGDLTALSRGDGPRVAELAAGALSALALPAALGAALAATVASLAQAGLRLDPGAIEFKPERLNPLPRIMDLFSWKKRAGEVAMSLLRVGAVGYVAYRALLVELPTVLALSRVTLPSAASTIVTVVLRVILSALTGLAIIAVVDYAQSRFSLEKEMKMTRKEFMDESRQQDGDPKAKGRMRARARAVARKRALNQVKTADVVVANPTHISVALRYSDKDAAPVVIAKGHDEVAMQIRSEARKHGIPILENRPLARALDAEVKIGHPVPAAHFIAVARVLAFVYKLRGGRKRAR